MIVSIIFGRGGSKSIEFKNLIKINGKRVLEYAIEASMKSKNVDKIYISSDCDRILEVGKEFNLELIKRPDYLCTDNALLEHAIEHACSYIQTKESNKVEIFVIHLCNAPNITSDNLDLCIDKLNSDSNFDSIVTVSPYPMFSPERARKDDGNGELVPYIPFSKFDYEVTSSRKNCPIPYFMDSGASVIKSSCMKDMKSNLPPFPWLGNKIGYIEQMSGGGDIDEEWQIALSQWWLSQWK